MSNYQRNVLILVFVYYCSTIFAIHVDLEEAMRRANIIPRVLDRAPKETLSVSYQQGFTYVYPGFKYTNLIKGLPTVNWTIDPPPVYYTIVAACVSEWELFDRKPYVCKAPIPETRLVHLLVVNCPSTDYNKGTILHPYRIPIPPQGYDKVYFIFLVYKQSRGILATDIRTRKKPSVKDFEKYRKFYFPYLSNLTSHFRLENLVAGTFFVYEPPDEDDI